MSRDALSGPGLEWPPGELMAGGLCSFGSGGTGVAVYRSTSDPAAVADFYGTCARRIR